MKSHAPLVTIGIPTYNRAAALRRAIASALSQDYPTIEVLISDNASTDGTREICEEFCRADPRVTYVRQPSNRGARANFAEVLDRASGEYFMWLGDDDWIDVSYVGHCLSLLSADPEMALVSGAPLYYRDGKQVFAGKLFDLTEDYWALRVAHYYAIAGENGMFHGLMRTAHLRRIDIPNAMGGDWHVVADVVSMGKSRMSAAVALHRELGGASASYRRTAMLLGLPATHAIFPLTATACGAWTNIVSSGPVYGQRALPAKIILAGVVFLLVITKPALGSMAQARHVLKRGVLAAFHFGVRRP